MIAPPRRPPVDLTNRTIQHLTRELESVADIVTAALDQPYPSHDLKLRLNRWLTQTQHYLRLRSMDPTP